MTGIIDNVSVKFMIDTGASVSLIREDILAVINAGRNLQLKTWNRNLVVQSTVNPGSSNI